MSWCECAHPLSLPGPAPPAPQFWGECGFPPPDLAESAVCRPLIPARLPDLPNLDLVWSGVNVRRFRGPSPLSTDLPPAYVGKRLTAPIRSLFALSRFRVLPLPFDI